jgi:predicted DCC family thiol-disulfide oxidoreductase YuxK
MKSTESDKSNCLLVVLYDDSCPYCSREIQHYKKRTEAKDIEWIPITMTTNLEDRFGITQAQALERFHVRDASGQWHQGAYAFAELWSHIHHYRVIANLIRKTGLLPIMDRAYSHFATWRLKRNCKTNTCAP